MNRLYLRVCPGPVALVCPARADDAEGVKKKLADAKKTYTNEAEKFRKAVGDLLDKREAKARKDGNKKLVDQTKAERAAFEDRGELPAGCSPALLTHMRTARTKLEAAFAAAVKEYVRLKEDAAAETTEKEQQQFTANAALLFGKRTYLTTLKAADVVTLPGWFEMDTPKAKMSGETVPHSILMHPDKNTFSSVSFPIGGRRPRSAQPAAYPNMRDSTTTRSPR